MAGKHLGGHVGKIRHDPQNRTLAVLNSMTPLGIGACRKNSTSCRENPTFSEDSTKAEIEGDVGSEWKANNLPQVAKSGHSMLCPYLRHSFRIIAPPIMKIAQTKKAASAKAKAASVCDKIGLPEQQ